MGSNSPPAPPTHLEPSPKGNEVATDSFLSAFGETDSSIFEEHPSPRRLRRPRQWNIPTFEDQCNGLNTFELRPDCGEEDILGVVLELEHRRHSTGSDLWDAALVLAHALSRPGVVIRGTDETRRRRPSTQSFLPNALAGMTVLELGSGTGAVGLFATKCLGAKHAILTDLPDNLNLLERNRKANGLEDQTDIMALDWQDTSLPKELQDIDIDLILGSDLFLPFATHLLLPLARSIRDLLQSQQRRRIMSKVQPPYDTSPKALICYEERFDVSAFFQEAQRLDLHVETVDPSLLHPIYQDPEYIKLLRISLKA